MKPLIRQGNWDVHLLEFVEATRNEPFKWAWQDCATWALRAIDVMCGTQHARPVLNQYNSLDGALAYAASRGWATAADACAEFCGPPLERVSRARRGDVLFGPTDDPFGQVLVVVGGGMVFGPGADGLVGIPFRRALLSHACTAFPVGAR